MTPRFVRPLTLLLAACSTSPHASAARRTEVAARGREVMPFDLSKTKHIFQDSPDGGLQTVTANDPADTVQVHLVRMHLTQEADKFSRGDFADPMTIHGHTMPGVAELRQGFRGIRVRYESIAGGATLRYTTTDPTLVAVLHRWFAAQRMEHGA